MLTGYPARVCSKDHIFGPPDETGPRKELYQALDADGICRPGELLRFRYVTVNKYTPENTSQLTIGRALQAETGFRPSRESYHGTEPVYVDKVMLTASEEDSFLIKILTRSTRRPEVGDKFSSRHGQKGVVGIIVNQEDMPFNERGICPDLIMNPHGFPSRMTVGKMIELLAGKAGVLEGKLKDGTVRTGERHLCTHTQKESLTLVCSRRHSVVRRLKYSPRSS